jgi:hypothetical protein
MTRAHKTWVKNFLISSSLSSKRLIENLSCGARQAYFQRDYARLKNIGEKFIDLSPRFEHIGRLYRVQGSRDVWDTDSLTISRELESLAEDSPLPVRAQALLLMAAKQIITDKPDATITNLLLESSKIAFACGDIPTFIRSQSQISLILSCDGNHDNSLQILKGLQLVINNLGSAYDVMKADYYNSVSFELFKLGRHEAAKRFAAMVMRSPYLSYYSEWRENLSEIFVKEEKRRFFAPSTSFKLANVLQFPVKKYQPAKVEMADVFVMIDSKPVRYNFCALDDLPKLDAFLKANLEARALAGLETNATK